MKLTWHVVHKDLRRFRAPIAALWISVAIEIALGVVLVGSAPRSKEELEPIAISLRGLWAVRWIGMYFLTAMIVLEDRLVGSDAFWLTRPIHAARLLGAKLITLAIVHFAGPLALAAVWWMWTGVGADALPAAAAEILLLPLGIVALALLLAALVRDLGRFVTVTLALVLAVAVTGPWLGRGFARWTLSPGSLEVEETRTWLVWWALLAAACVASACHYMRRRRILSVSVAAAGLGFASVVGMAWPFPLMRWVDDEPAETRGAEAQIRWTRIGNDIGRGREKLLHVGLRLLDWPAEYTLRHEGAVLVLTWPDGNTLRLQSVGYRESNDLQNLPPRDDASNPQRTVSGELIFTVASDAKDRLMREAASATIDLQLQVLRTRAAEPVRLHAASTRPHAQRPRIDAFTIQPDGSAEVHLTSLRAGRGGLEALKALRFERPPEIQRMICWPGLEPAPVYQWNERGLQAAGVAIRYATGEIFRYESFESAELIEIALRPIGTLRRQLGPASLSLSPENPRRSRPVR